VKGNTKGITPVIAIILLMMITIALAGFTYIWLQGVFKTSSNNTKTQLEQQQRSMMKTIRIDSATSGTGELAIRNTGSESITSNEIAVFVNGTKVGCTGLGDIAPGSVGTCNISGGCGSNDEVKVTAPGNSDVALCQ